MATPAQIIANRANAQKSTGPRSPEGKAAARFNALQHGLHAESLIIPGEDPEELRRLTADYQSEFRPASPAALFHVDTMVRADWQKRRLLRLEADVYRIVLAENPELATALLSDSPAAKLLLRVQRQLAALERTWYRAHSELRHARKEAEDADLAAFDAFISRPAPGPRLTDLASFLPPAACPVSEPSANLALRL
jgi:hypothetical protein